MNVSLRLTDAELAAVAEAMMEWRLNHHDAIGTTVASKCYRILEQLEAIPLLDSADLEEATP